MGNESCRKPSDVMLVVRSAEVPFPAVFIHAGVGTGLASVTAGVPSLNSTHMPMVSPGASGTHIPPAGTTSPIEPCVVKPVALATSVQDGSAMLAVGAPETVNLVLIAAGKPPDKLAPYDVPDGKVYAPVLLLVV
jgi:hypothetical protein